MRGANVEAALEMADRRISAYLETARETGRIDQQSYSAAKKHTFPNLKKWLEDPYVDEFSPGLKEGVFAAIDGHQWENIVNAYRQSVRFGTGGIRGLMASDRASIELLHAKGIHAPILKGPNTINDLVVLLTSVGVAKFGKAQHAPFEKVVIGYDSRVNGRELASIVARLFLGYGYQVFFFDAPCPYPEVTFAIPYESIKADVGILISASHNDYRYNGYKLSCANGSQFDIEQRDAMYNQYIAEAEPKDIRLPPFRDAPKDALRFLGGERPLEEFDYAGREHCLENLHAQHCEHVERFILTPDLAERQQAASSPLKIAYCAFHGAGRIAVPRLLREVGFSGVRRITVDGLNDLNGLFPSFCSESGREQQPDPGDPRAAETAVNAFNREFPGEFEDLDILLGTDPDADRCGVVVKVPESQRHLCEGKSYRLLTGDEAWMLLLWYRLQCEIATSGHVKDAEKKFVTLSHTTSDAIARLARKHGLGVVKTWVGFGVLAAGTQMVWNGDIGEIVRLQDGRTESDPRQLCHPFVCSCEGMETGHRSINVAAMEQSNGFSILGAPPPDSRSLGKGGHVRDKDGTLAALLVAEVAAWAKERGTSIWEILDRHVHSDPDVGLFVNLYEPDPLDGEYPGIEGDRLKKNILRRALGYFQLGLSGDLSIGGLRVKSACVYRTGKYDALYPATYDFQFPDEGVRFFFDTAKLDHLTVRPSGTGNSLRFHVQLHSTPTESELITQKGQLIAQGRAILDDVRLLLKAPRN